MARVYCRTNVIRQVFDGHGPISGPADEVLPTCYLADLDSSRIKLSLNALDFLTAPGCFRRRSRGQRTGGQPIGKALHSLSTGVQRSTKPDKLQANPADPAGNP